jgi:glycine cleavage system H protein
MNFPDDLKYTREHEWVRIDGNIATIGITEFAQSELGDIVYVEVETIGEVVDKNDVFGTVEAVKTTSDLFMPITAKVLELNSKIDEKGGNDVTLVNSDPYGDGWIIKAEIMNEEEVAELMDAASYRNLIGK